MKINYAKQLNYSNLVTTKFEFVIAASGYEKRSTYLIQKLKNVPTENLILFRFKEKYSEPQRKINDEIFKKFGFDINSNIISEGSYQEVIEILDDHFDKVLLKTTPLNILIDYSCMTKVWYATILNYFLNKYSEIEAINLFFSYSPASYAPPFDPMPNQYMGPVPGIYKITANNKPTALIIGLGYEKHRSFGLNEYIDPQTTYLLYTKPALDQQYVSDIEENHRELLKSVGSDKIFTHPLDDLVAIESLLTSLYLSLRDKYTVVFAPLGPKPVALISIILALRYSDIDVWRVSSGGIRNVYDREPYSTDPIICQVNLISEAKFVNRFISDYA